MVERKMDSIERALRVEQQRPTTSSLSSQVRITAKVEDDIQGFIDHVVWEEPCSP